MNTQLTKQLIETYPELYAGTSLPPTQGLMCFGFECGDGWFQIINALSWALTQLIRQDHQIEAIQVKEKWGSLRFYINSGPDEAYALIDMAEFLSERTCENCGSTTNVTSTEKGWIQHLCPICKESHGRTN